MTLILQCRSAIQTHQNILIFRAGVSLERVLIEKIWNTYVWYFVWSIKVAKLSYYILLVHPYYTTCVMTIIYCVPTQSLKLQSDN